MEKLLIPNNWSRIHAECFLLLCMADADLNLMDDELEIVTKKLAEKLTNEEDIHHVVKECRKKLAHLEPYERVPFLKKCKEKFKLNADHYDALVHDLRKIALSDDLVQKQEMDFLMEIKRLFLNAA